ncbi:MAG: hypothetical protein ICV87_05350 [Gemmatimonadetes bacterium]|nr:hypothetical protein [Gemmatimonadota bacterium]
MSTSDAPARSGIQIARAEPPAEQTSVHEPAVRPWELELLISLSLVFALMQLPSQVDPLFTRLMPQVDGGMRVAVIAGYQLIKLPLYLMIAAFVLHLAVRAYWVGMIGLEAVFPAGVRWDELRYGPVTKELQRERIGSLQPMIDRADRFGSIIFSTSFAILVTLFFSALLAAVAGGLAFLISTAFFGGEHLFRAFVALMGVALVPPLVVSALDKSIGARLPEGSRARRWLRGGALFSFYSSGTVVTGTVWLVLFSNLRRHTVTAALWAVLLSLFTFFIVKDVLIQNDAVSTDSYAYLPEGIESRSLRHSVYENLRPAGGDYDNLPSIQADVVTGPFLKLFIPYSPMRMNVAMKERCPGLPVLGGSGLRMPVLDTREITDAAQARVLECWASLQPVKLNGALIRPAFRFYAHPQTQLRGIIAYIPTEGMPRGENVLEVGSIPRTTGAPARRRESLKPYVIPFWR